VSKPELFDIAELRQVAKWYYADHVPKKEIAKRLHNIEIRGVTRRLKQARERGIVRIEIPETVECGEEHELRQQFPHLRKIITVPNAEYPELFNLWGVEAARYFEELTARGQHHVGISGGETLLTFCETLGTHRRDNVHIHTTALIGRGELASTASHVDPLVNATILWSKCGRVTGHCHYATVPPYDGVTREKITAELDGLAKRQPIREVIKRMDDITIAFAGLGLVKSKVLTSQLTMTGLLEPIISPEQLAEEGAFADLAYCLFDLNGATQDRWRFFLTAGACDDDPNRRGIGFFKQMVKDGKTVIVIAGTRKERAVYAALKAELFNVWITDRGTLADVHNKAFKDSELLPS